MISTEVDNLRNAAAEAKGVLRDDIIAAMEAGANEICRLQEVVIKYQAQVRALKPRS